MIVTKNINEFNDFAKEFTLSLKPNDRGATVVGLSGDLGSGKTTFAQEVARTLGISEIITSPTFVIEKIYKLPVGQIFEHLIHIDAYRLEKENELERLGWREITENSKNLVLIEWPEKVSGLIPKNSTTIHFKFVDEQTREIIEIKS